MKRQRALRLAREWAQGHRCSLRDGEAAEYHSMFAAMLEESMSNEPLTLEQLREMDGEPVYIHSDIFPEDCGWRVIARADVLRIYFTDRTSLSLTDYGKSWIAYRRPPEGEA